MHWKEKKRRTEDDVNTELNRACLKPSDRMPSEWKKSGWMGRVSGAKSKPLLIVRGSPGCLMSLAVFIRAGHAKRRSLFTFWASFLIPVWALGKCCWYHRDQKPGAADKQGGGECREAVRVTEIGLCCWAKPNNSDLHTPKVKPKQSCRTGGRGHQEGVTGLMWRNAGGPEWLARTTVL